MYPVTWESCVLKRHMPSIHLDAFLFARIPGAIQTLELPNIKSVQVAQWAKTACILFLPRYSAECFQERCQPSHNR